MNLVLQRLPRDEQTVISSVDIQYIRRSGGALRRGLIPRMDLLGIPYGQKLSSLRQSPYCQAGLGPDTVESSITTLRRADPGRRSLVFRR
jgi:hypothetical protein